MNFILYLYAFYFVASEEQYLKQLQVEEAQGKSEMERRRQMIESAKYVQFIVATINLKKTPNTVVYLYF